MLATHQVVEGEDRWSSLTAMQNHVCSEALDDVASDCSTVSGDQDVNARHEDCLSDGSSEACSEVETLLIFDWDDTLFPTSWLQEQGLLIDGVSVSAEQKVQLELVAERARLTLQMALEIGKVVIVTNASHGWIEMSSTKFTPSLVSLLKTVDMVSARSIFEQYSQAPSEWKRMAFENEVDLFYGSGHAGQQRNIVSVGDSLHELHALKSVTKSMPGCCGKSVKLMEAPSIEQLIEQHEVLSACFMDVVEHNGDLDVEIGADNSE